MTYPQHLRKHVGHIATMAEVDAMAELVHAARPSWDFYLVRIVLLSHREQVDGADLAIAALRLARDPRYDTPKAIGWRGPHWDGLGTTPPEVKSAERCATCGKVEPRCYSDRKGPDDHVFEAQSAYLARIGKDR